MSDGAQGVQGWVQPAGQSTEPDWAALAEQNELNGRRRKQRQVIGAVVGATLVIGGITATAVGVAGHGKGDGPAKVAAGRASATPAESSLPFDPSASPSPSASATPGDTAAASPGTSTSGSPTAGSSSRPAAKPGSQPPATAPGAAPQQPAPGGSGPRDPLTVISSAATDTAPLDPSTLFAAQTLSIGGHTWTRVTTAATDPCWKATTGGLGDVISPQGCHTVLRATYASGDSAVTVGVAVFDQRSQADAAQQAHKGQVQGLVTAGSTSYCVTPGCANTHGAVGRYGYYTVSGTLKPGGNTADATATAAGSGFAGYVQGRLLARGQ